MDTVRAARRSGTLQAVLAFGAIAARSLLERRVGVLAERGRRLEREGRLRVLISLHPSAPLRLDSAPFDAAFAAGVDDLRQADAVLKGP